MRLFSKKLTAVFIILGIMFGYNLIVNGATPTPTSTIPTPTQRTNIITYYIEKVTDASEQGPVQGKFRLWTTQSGPVSGDGYLRVNYTISGTATNGTDYQAIEGYVYVLLGMFGPPLPSGTPRDYIYINPVTDSLIEGTETVTITLTGVNVGAGKGSATVNIADLNEVITPTPTYRVTPTPRRASPPPPTNPVTPTPRVTGNYAVSYTIQSDWGNGATIDVTIKNNTTAPVNGWTLAWTFSGNQTITNLWNGTFTQSGASVSVKNAAHNATISAGGGSVNFGFNLNYSGSNAKPTSFTLNGTACTVL